MSFLEMDFPARRPAPCPAPALLLEDLRVIPEQVLSAQHYLAAFRDAKAVQRLAPDLEQLARLDRAAVIVTAPGGPGDFISRFCAPANGVPRIQSRGLRIAA
jgi:predicted PhzF superfamily epimerase YddE/YHI9